MPAAKRQNHAVALDAEMHAEITALADQYSRTLGFRISRTSVIRMALTAFKLHRERAARRHAHDSDEIQRKAL